MPIVSTISPCLWFDAQAEDAVRMYVDIFRNSRIIAVSRHGAESAGRRGVAPGSVLTVAFELDGQAFTALNGGPRLRFNEAVSFQVHCDTQGEIDYYWTRLGEGGDEAARQCGWLKDRFGLSWQVVPRSIAGWISGDARRADRVLQAMLPMKKLDLAALRRAYEG